MTKLIYMTKICKYCQKEKSIIDFYKNNKNKDKLSNICKKCDSERNRTHRVTNKEHIKNYQLAIKDKRNATRRARHQAVPWKQIFTDIKYRCNNINARAYKWYGDRGIECRITEEELKELWFRDKAYLLKKPSIDRIDNDGNYELNNCQFIELIDNIEKSNIERKIYS